MQNILFTSESVTAGHPDKVCDKIADVLLDNYISQDPNSRVAIEVAVTKQFCLVFGEVTSKASLDIESIIRQTICEIGYDDNSLGFNGKTLKILNKVKEQSPDISFKVNKEDGAIGAGDQGIIFGYASDETPSYMPLSITLAHKLAERLDECRKSGIITDLRPDGKTQVTVIYDKDLNIIGIDSIVISYQHNKLSKTGMKQKNQEIYEKVVKEIIPADLLKGINTCFLNNAGPFVIGGPYGDSGLTGRKLISDSYGGHSRHGGGALSGKDPSKVDRSAAYIARYIAKNLVAAGICKKAEVQLGYVIGNEKPVSIYVDTFHTSSYDSLLLGSMIEEIFNLTPKGIIDKLNLTDPIYKKTATYGHFGNPEYLWEQLDMVDKIKEYLHKND